MQIFFFLQAAKQINHLRKYFWIYMFIVDHKLLWGRSCKSSLQVSIRYDPSHIVRLNCKTISRKRESVYSSQMVLHCSYH